MLNKVHPSHIKFIAKIKNALALKNQREQDSGKTTEQEAPEICLLTQTAIAVAESDGTVYELKSVEGFQLPGGRLRGKSQLILSNFSSQENNSCPFATPSHMAVGCTHVPGAACTQFMEDGMGQKTQIFQKQGFVL